MSKKILIVEDDKFLRELISQKLIKVGFEIITAEDGETALKIIIDNKPALVLLDLIMPGIDGFGVLTEMKKNEETEKIPVIILSNLGQKEEIEKGMRLGATDFMIKAQFSPNEIVDKVKSILG